MTYNAGSRLVTSVEGAVVSTYTFDANGNQTAVNAAGSRTTYAYDYENRLRTVVEPGNVRTTLAYYAEGLRRTKTTVGGSTTFVWDGSDYLQARSGSEIQTFSVVKAQMLSQEVGGTEGLFVPDTIGSLVKLLDASGNALYEASYWPYGEEASSTGVNDSMVGYVGTFGYVWDSVKRMYVRAREYDPATGRWLTVDPWTYSQPAYTYVGNSPRSYIDPSGKYCQSPNPCSSDSSTTGACIALLCSFEMVDRLITDLRKGLGISEKELKEIIKYFKGMNGKEYNPYDCCKKAKGNPQGPGFNFFPPGFRKPSPEWVIKRICEFASSKPGYFCKIIRRTRTMKECLEMCNGFPGVIGEQCRIACSYTDFNVDPSERSNEQCEANARL